MAALLSLVACAPETKKVVTAGASGESAEDRVGADDVFDVRVYGEAELSGAYRVATDGTIDYPLAGRLNVAGLRTGEIQHLLVTKLKGGYLQDPQVTVTIKERNSQKISVFGQVSKPGQVAYYPNMTIVDAIASAGGFTGIAAKNSVNLRREVGGKIETHVFPVADIAEGQSQNVRILPGDVLVVDERVF
ncbi:MAG TPA: polysaccharide biosynthesis/export family protein [Polyangia bacterium]|nr:polysaccharide biosynthesis/export family protein [Polyangia bacterium]